MAKKLYVGSLPYETTAEELNQLFSQVGAVTSATVITDKYSGRSKGFGFVEMANDDEADAAIAKFNGSDMGGRSIVVNEARPMGDKPPRRTGGFGGGGRGGFGGGGGRGGFGGGRGGYDR